MPLSNNWNKFILWSTAWMPISFNTNVISIRQLIIFHCFAKLVFLRVSRVTADSRILDLAPRLPYWCSRYYWYSRTDTHESVQCGPEREPLVRVHAGAEAVHEAEEVESDDECAVEVGGVAVRRRTWGGDWGLGLAPPLAWGGHRLWRRRRELVQVTNARFCNVVEIGIISELYW